MLKQGLYLSVLNCAGRALNFILFLLIANKFGATQTTDWFFFLFAIIYLINTIFIKSVENVFVPIISENKTGTIYQLFHFTITITLWGTLLTLLICTLAGFWLAPHIFGIPLEISWQLGLAICLLLSCQPGLALLSSFFSSYLQATQRYLLPTIYLALRTIGIIPFLILPMCNTIFCLTIAFLVGELCRLVILGKRTFQEISNEKCPFETTKKNSYRTMLQHVGWVSLALALSQLNPTIDLAMAGKLGYGSVTIVEYAIKFRGLPILVLGGFLTMLLGEWSNRHFKGGRSLDLQEISRTIITVFFITSAITWILFISIDSWLNLFFFSHKFTSENLADIRNLLLAYFPGVPFLAACFVCTKALLVYRKTKIIALISIISIALNIIFNFIFIKRYGLHGIAISTSCLDIFSFLFLVSILYNLAIKLGSQNNNQKYNL